MRKSLSLLVIAFSFEAGAQILDDSTQLVYGPHTTQFLFESDIINNELDYQKVDTSLYLFERQSYMDRGARKYQNLGNFGTAVTPLFVTPQEAIGRTSGFNAYSAYSRGGLDKIKFYDTKSPFIDLFAYLGSGNKNIVNVDHSRNVREGWNLGFDLHKITTDKIIANDGQGDRQTENTTFDFYTHYQNREVPYQALFYLSKLSHKVVELGGVRFGEDSVLSELFELNNAELSLKDAQNFRKETQWHLYHDFRIAEQFQLYHSLDLYREENTYQDFSDPGSSDYDTYSDAYNGVFLIDQDSTYERSSLATTTNEVGIKGDLSSIFYRAYLKARSVDFNYSLIDPYAPVTETYLGGYARFNWREKFKVIGEGELMQSGEYQLRGKLRSEVLNVDYLSKKYRVPFLYGAYFGNHFEWSNNFNSVFVNAISGNLNLTYKSFTFKPMASFTAYTDYLYFDENQLPQQAPAGIAIASIGGSVNAGFIGRKGEGFYIENEVVATNVSGGSAEVMRVPELLYNGRYYWRGLIFGDNIPVEIGVDAHARSAYFANSYVPVTQQFHLQNEFRVPGYYKADVFLNMKLDKFFLGVKWAHFDQPSDGGYFSTPYYPGLPGGFDLMIRWLFFD